MTDSLDNPRSPLAPADVERVRIGEAFGIAIGGADVLRCIPSSDATRRPVYWTGAS